VFWFLVGLHCLRWAQVGLTQICKPQVVSESIPELGGLFRCARSRETYAAIEQVSNWSFASYSFSGRFPLSRLEERCP